VDRGFVGNKEIRDAFASFPENHNAALVFVTDGHTEKYLKISLNTLRDKGAECIKVLPLFISAASSHYQLARELLPRQHLTVPISSTHPYGESFSQSKIWWINSALSNHLQTPMSLLLDMAQLIPSVYRKCSRIGSASQNKLLLVLVLNHSG
jgi:hypothetical protein